MATPYSIAVMSDDSYDNLVAEVVFEDKDVGLILSQEASRDHFEIAVFSLMDDAREKFYETKKVGRVTLDLKDFLAAVEDAKERLRELDRA